MDINLHCRTCAAIIVDMPKSESLLDSTNLHLKWAVNNYTLKIENALPNKICSSCVDHIKISMMFHERCNKAQEYFQLVLPNSTPKTNLDNTSTELDINKENTEENIIQTRKSLKNSENNEDMTISFVKITTVKTSIKNEPTNDIEIVEISSETDSNNKYPSDLSEYIKQIKLNIPKYSANDIKELKNSIEIEIKNVNNNMIQKTKLRLVNELLEDEINKRKNIKIIPKIEIKNELVASAIPINVDLIEKTMQLLNSRLNQSKNSPNIENISETSSNIKDIVINNSSDSLHDTKVETEMDGSVKEKASSSGQSIAVVNVIEITDDEVTSDYDSDATVMADVKFEESAVDTDIEYLETRAVERVVLKPKSSPPPHPDCLDLSSSSLPGPESTSNVNQSTTNQSSDPTSSKITQVDNKQPVQRKFNCDSCSYTSKNKTNLIVHIKNKHIKYYSCKICNKKYKSSNTLKLHLKSDHENVTHQCQICDKKFKYSAHLRTHIKTHFDNSTCIECPTCKEIFNKKSTYNKHVNFVHGSLKHKFDYVNNSEECKKQKLYKCSQKFKTKNKILVHKIKHEEKKSNFSYFKPLQNKHKNFKCKKCESIFKNKYELKEHKKQLHSKVKLYSCIICLKTFKSRSGINYHNKNVHIDLNCKICNEEFETKEQFKKHKNITCKYCSCKFTCTSLLVKHVVLCSTKTYSCSFCKLELITKKSIEMHIYKEHLDNYFLFKCEICKKPIKTANELELHKKEIHKK